MGWIENRRHGNKGGVGNTIEDILGIRENNLPIPNAAEWELKCQRVTRNGATALLTLFHMEPSPRAVKFVPNVLLPKYGWPASRRGEVSFRQTISGNSRSDRGFMVTVDRGSKKVLISFDASKVDCRHRPWLQSVEKRAGLSELDPQPYWGFEDLYAKARTKLLNCFYIMAERRTVSGKEYFNYTRIQMLQDFSFEGLLALLEAGDLFVDFDARTGRERNGHNHGTKFRLRAALRPELYKKITEI